MEQPYPMKLIPACKDYIWGGTKLRDEYGKKSSAEILAESWELSCHPDGPSVIANGKYRGTLLPDFLRTAGPAVLGTDCEKFPDFPILIKLIDAKDRLSIQVHPDNEYARTHEGGFGKTEMWYVVDCEPGAGLYYGFKNEVSKDEFRRRIEDNTLPEVLNLVPVHRGDVFFIESGTLHAIGAGILIAEIQQNSNLTYRIFDYGRLGKDGKPRALHIPQALDITRREPPSRPARPQGKPESFFGYERTLLGSCEYFSTSLLKVEEASLVADARSFHSLLCLEGEALILDAGKPLLSFGKGDSVLIPASMGAYTVKGSCRLLFTEV